MKKILGIIIVVALALFLVTPFVLGMHAEKNLQETIARLNAYPGYSAEVKTFESGWFSSRAELQVGIEIPAGLVTEEDDFDLESLSVTGILAIDHGPLLLSEGLQLGLYNWRLWLDNADADNAFEHRGFMALNGHVRFRDRVESLDYPLNSGETQLHFDGYSGDGEIDTQGQLTYRGAVDVVSIDDEEESLRVEDIRMEMDGDLSRLDWDLFLYPGDFTISVGSLVASLDGGLGVNDIQLQNLSLASTIVIPEDAAWMSMTMQTRLPRLEVNDWFLRDLQWDMAFDNISMDFYRAYHQATVAMYENMDQTDSDALPAMDFGQYITPEVIQSLVEKGPGLRLDKLSGELPQGEFSGSASIHIKADAQPPSQLTNPLWLMGALQAQAQLQMDRTLAEHYARRMAEPGIRISAEQDPELTEEDIQQMIGEQAQATLEMLVQQGLVVSSDMAVSSQMTYNSGEMTVNGKPMPLGALLGGGAP